jgi:hypothetical protein
MSISPIVAEESSVFDSFEGTFGCLSRRDSIIAACVLMSAFNRAISSLQSDGGRPTSELPNTAFLLFGFVSRSANAILII